MALSQAAPYSVAEANLALLRQRLREALFAKKARLRELMELCKAQRAELRGWIKQRREQALAELRDELRNARAAAQAARHVRLQDARRTATSDVELARAAVEIERAHAAEHRRITRAHETKRVAIDKAHVRSLSDDTMSKAVLKRLAPLLEKARKIRPAPGESRTEAVWRYARAHPEEMHALLEPKTEQAIAQTRKEIAAAEEAIRAGGRAPGRAERIPPRKPAQSTPLTARQKSPRPHPPSPRAAAPVVPRAKPAAPFAPAAELSEPKPVAGAPPSPPVVLPAAAPVAVPALPSPPSHPKRSRAPRPRPQLGLDFNGPPATAPTVPVATAEPPPAPSEPGAVEPKRAWGPPNPYEQKKAARIERQRGCAEKLRSEAEGAHARAQALGAIIPLGQPILVGHHSQRRHERDIGKIDKAMRKSVELSRAAQTLERRAASAEKSRTISSDDPEAIAKLRTKLAGIDKDRARMREANAAIRAGGDVAARLKARGFSDKLSRELLQPDPMGRIGFPSYALQNASAESARITARIADLEKRAATPARPTETFGDATLAEEENRVRLSFPCIPPEAVRADLKRSGFHWSRSAGVWQRMTSNAAWSEARRILAAYAAGGAGGVPPATCLPSP